MYNTGNVTVTYYMPVPICLNDKYHYKDPNAGYLLKTPWCFRPVRADKYKKPFCAGVNAEPYLFLNYGVGQGAETRPGKFQTEGIGAEINLKLI